MIFASIERRAGAPLLLSISERSIELDPCIKLRASCIKMHALSTHIWLTRREGHADRFIHLYVVRIAKHSGVLIRVPSRVDRTRPDPRRESGPGPANRETARCRFLPAELLSVRFRLPESFGGSWPCVRVM